jgi:hypothetical protein
MLEKVENKDPGWEEWLKKYRIYDDTLDEDSLYLRY